MLERLQSGSVDIRQVRETAVLLKNRIQARFPDAGLLGPAQDLVTLVDRAPKTVHWYSRNWWTWLVLATVILLGILGGIGAWIRNQSLEVKVDSVVDLAQLADSAPQAIIGITILVLVLYSPLKRRRISRANMAINQLKQLAKVVLAHAIEKDPEHLNPKFQATKVTVDLGACTNLFLMGRYLKYCVDLLNGIGTLASYYDEWVSDSEVFGRLDRLDQSLNDMVRNVMLQIQLLKQVEDDEEEIPSLQSEKSNNSIIPSDNGAPPVSSSTTA